MSERVAGASAAQTVAAHPPLSVAITTIGVMAVGMIGSTISSQLVDLDIADVGGGFSVSADDASWIACIATMAEVVSIPIAAILVRALSLRRVAIYSALVYLVCACMSLLVSGEDGLIVLRAMQSFCSGTISVLMFVSVMATLPPGFARTIGLALFCFASTAPSALNASAGAFVTERWGWQGLYYFDITWGLTFFLLTWRFLRPTPRAMRLAEIDWLGYAILAVGLAGFILFVKQGDRFFWLDNPVIRHAGFIAAIALPLALALLLFSRRPLLDLGLMASPTFGWAIALATFYRFGLVMTAFVVPQTLMRLQAFRMPEIAEANIWSFWAQCVSFPLAWLWASRGDARQPLSVGLGLFAAGAFVATWLTAQWQANDFRLAMILIGLGEGLFLVPTVFYATRDVKPEQGPTAAALFNLSRIVGQTFGTGMVAALIRDREDFHSAQLVDSVNNANSAVAERLHEMVERFLATNGNATIATKQAWASLSATLSNQAYVLAFADAFVIIAAVLGVSALLVLMLPQLHPKSARTSTPTAGAPAMVNSGNPP
jgi:MFS transporter, DHA2 family, multidrug resistance protein|nr:MFS transporter [Bradyrhizobium sp.]